MTVSELLGQGLIITAIGLGLVFAALALLWGLIRLIGAVLADREDKDAEPLVVPMQATVTVTTHDGQISTQSAVEALTEERAMVAAIVAGALLANALPIHWEPPAGPTFEHGRSAPSWVTSNRARTLQSWQPPRTEDR